MAVLPTEKTTRQRILSNVGWAFAGKIVSLTSVLIVGILVARYLGPAQYGLLNYVISYVAIFTIVSNFGLDDIEVREMSKSAQNCNDILWTSTRLRLCLASITYLLIIITTQIHHYDNPETLAFILVYGLTVFPSCLNSIRNYFTAQLLNKNIVKAEIVRTIVCSLLKIVLLLIKAPLIWFIITSAMDIFVVCGGYYVSLKMHNKELCKYSYNHKLTKFLLIEAFPLMLSSSAIIIYQKIDQVMIGDMIDEASVGFFATAGRFADLVIFIPIVICQTLTPILVKVKSDKTATEYELWQRKFVGTILWSSIIIALIMSLSASLVIKLTFGQAYLASIPILQIMAWKAVGTALATSSGQLIIIDRKQKWTVVRNIIGCVVCITANLIIIPVYGAVGSAITTVITVIFAGFISNAIIPDYRKYFSIQLRAFIYGPSDILKLRLWHV
ncbi:MAG: flippase [Muribaculum sp.]|nr:flippase [Muribaculum sp.]